MFKNNIVTRKYQSIRQLPKNIKKEHMYLFNNEFSKNIDDTFVFKKNNIVVSKSMLFKFKFISLNPKFFKMDIERWNNFKISFNELIKFFIKSKNYQKIPQASWVIDDKSFNYFHWMTDVLSRVEMLSEYDLKEFPILIPRNFCEAAFITETLKVLSIPHIFYDEDKKYLIGTLLITSHAAPAGNYNKFLIQKVKHKLVDASESESINFDSKKLWVSRSGQKRRLVKNEDKVTKFLIKDGFKVIYPENYTVIEQIKIFSNAEIVIAPHGAALTNIMFMKKNSKIMEIRIFSDSVRNSFFTLCSEFEQFYYYFLADANSEDLVEDLEINLDKFIDEYTLFKAELN